MQYWINFICYRIAVRACARLVRLKSILSPNFNNSCLFWTLFFSSTYLFRRISCSIVIVVAPHHISNQTYCSCFRTRIQFVLQFIPQFKTQIKLREKKLAKNFKKKRRKKKKPLWTQINCKERAIETLYAREDWKKNTIVITQNSCKWH